jgi:hypothetical protein
VRHNTQRDPLLWLAGLAFSASDCADFVRKYARMIGEWLVLCAQELQARFDTCWWLTLGLPVLWAASTAVIPA